MSLSGAPDHPMRDPALAAKLFAELREAEPLAALRDLSAWLQEAQDIPSDQEQVRNEILALIQEAGDVHVAKLLTQSIARQSGQQAPPASNWNALDHYQRGLMGALCSSATHLLGQAKADASLQLQAAGGAARALRACRVMAKACLVRYLSVPPKVWQLAYAVHREAENADAAAKSIRMNSTQKASTTATQELLRLLMLQSSSPEMMSPEQIEVADRVIEQLGGDFTLRPRGSADNAFWFDPGSEQPPQRAASKPPQPGVDTRYFGPGMGFDSLERFHKELGQMRRAADAKPFGKDIPAYVQASGVRHLLMFWGQASPYTPPAHAEATGSVKVIHGYGQIWQQLSHGHSATTELSLTEDDDGPALEPETWTLHDTGGAELGVEIPLRSGDWARSGDAVAVSLQGDGKYWFGLIRSMHAEPGRAMHANIAILSREPQAVQLRAVIEQGAADAGITESAARQFAFNNVRAVILSDGSAGSQKANFLVSPEHWQAGRVYEGTVAGTVRHLHSLQLLRQGDDYVRASFEWVSIAQA
jgi:TfoX/Sxy family transcriptional regulator of competence genes